MPSASDLVLRRPRAGDEASARRAHAELAGDGFDFLFSPELPWADQLAALAAEERGLALAPGRVRASYRLAVVGTTLVGRVSLRHELTPVLVDVGGHIGYAVRPAYRRRGYATRMLELGLDHLAGEGLRRALVTCDEDNVGSRAVIEGCGGEFQDVREVAPGLPGKRRYWFDLSGRAGGAAAGARPGAP